MADYYFRQKVTEAEGGGIKQRASHSAPLANPFAAFSAGRAIRQRTISVVPIARAPV